LYIPAKGSTRGSLRAKFYHSEELSSPVEGIDTNKNYSYAVYE